MAWLERWYGVLVVLLLVGTGGMGLPTDPGVDLGEPIVRREEVRGPDVPASLLENELRVNSADVERISFLDAPGGMETDMDAVFEDGDESPDFGPNTTHHDPLPSSSPHPPSSPSPVHPRETTEPPSPYRNNAHKTNLLLDPRYRFTMASEALAGRKEGQDDDNTAQPPNPYSMVDAPLGPVPLVYQGYPGLTEPPMYPHLPGVEGTYDFEQPLVAPPAWLQRRYPSPWDAAVFAPLSYDSAKAPTLMPLPHPLPHAVVLPGGTPPFPEVYHHPLFRVNSRTGDPAAAAREARRASTPEEQLYVPPHGPLPAVFQRLKISHALAEGLFPAERDPIDCSTLDSCDACVRHLLCGWCESNHHCDLGGLAGPLLTPGVCHENAYHFLGCPTTLPEEVPPMYNPTVNETNGIRSSIRLGSSSSSSGGSLMLGNPGDDRHDAEKEAEDISDPDHGPMQDLKLPEGMTSPEGFVGQPGDEVVATLKRLNPTFHIFKNHEWSSYPMVLSATFARVLVDNDGMVVAIDRQ